MTGERRDRGSAKPKDDAIKVLIRNRKARHDYHIDEDFECGMALTGSEVKSLRASNATLVDAFGHIRGGELFLEGCQIEPYPQAGALAQHDPFRPRKLLMKKQEIQRLLGKVESKGYTLIPLELYSKRGKIKLQLALAKGKKEWDKREATRERDVKREMDQEVATARKR